jgi:WD40 repeat protein
MQMQNDAPEDNVGSEATLPRPENHQSELKGFGPKAIVLAAMCLLAVVVPACFLWAKWHHPTRPLDNYLREVSSVAFSPDGKRIAAGMIFSGGGGIEKEEHCVRVWDAATGHQDLC